MKRIYLFLVSLTMTIGIVSGAYAQPADSSYVKTSASVYPLLSPILVNYTDSNYLSTDRIGIYKKGEVPGIPAPTLIQYVAQDSGTVEFAALPLGDYVVYLLCCDGYEIKDSISFKVAGTDTPSIVAPAYSFVVGEDLEFTYNDPNVGTGSTTEWIGIYNEGDLPGGPQSLVWDYLTQSTGTMTFAVPYPNGTQKDNFPGVPLGPGEYFAGLFYNDGYEELARTSFVIVEEGTGVGPELEQARGLVLYPNPTSGLVEVKLSNTDQLQKIAVYNLAGQVVYQEELNGSVSHKTLDLKHLGKGLYFVEAKADTYTTSRKLIVK